MKFTHLHEGAAAFAYRTSKDAPFITTTGVPVLGELQESMTSLNEATMRLIAASGQAMRHKGTLNEKQYPGRLERARHDAGALRKVKSEQMAMRCRYQSGRIVIHPTRWHVDSAIKRVNAAVEATVAFVNTLGKSEDEQLISDICRSNCVRAQELVAAAQEVWQKASEEVCNRDSDVTRGLAQQAMLDAFAELSKPDGERMLLLWNDDLLFSENLAVQVIKDDELGALMIDFQAKFADAWEKLHAAKFEVSHLQMNRGTLNEDQYAIRIERAEGDEFERQYKAQRQLRQIHHANMVSVRWLVAEALRAVDALEPVYNAMRDILVNGEKHAANQQSQRIMACGGGELVVFACINNCVAAEALIRDTRGRKAAQFAQELAKDITEGQAEAATQEIFAELSGKQQKRK